MAEANPSTHQKIKAKYLAIETALAKNGVKIQDALHVEKKTYAHMKSHGTPFNIFTAYLIKKHIKNIHFKDLMFDNVELPAKLSVQKKTMKIRELAKFLDEEHHISFARAMSISKQKAERLLSGHDLPSAGLMKRITTYFYFSPKLFTDDSLDLPPFTDIKVDENLVSIQRDDFANQVELYKNKHMISRNYRVLGHRRRGLLFFQLGLIVIPLLAYTGYCSYVIINDRVKTVEKYHEDGLSSSQQAIQDGLPQKEDSSKPHYDPTLTYANINVGSQIMKISNITPSNSSYITEMTMWMDFDQVEYFKMHCVTYNKAINEPLTNDLKFRDIYSYNHVDGHFSYAPDSVPDWMQVMDLTIVPTDPTDPQSIKDAIAKLVVREEYVRTVAAYPGETASNNYSGKETMFAMGNGSFIADSFAYEVNNAYSLTEWTDEHKTTIKNVQFRFFQKFSFEATISKQFDNPRYPLDSVQFHIYILPMQLTTVEARYVATDTIDITKAYWGSQGIDCSLDMGTFVAGVAPFFSISGGYKLINNGEIKNFVTRLNYYQDNDSQANYSTEYEILLRANRQGFSLFLQAFVNLFAVVIWITIAFYSQSYHGENQLGMLGTGLFAAISSIIVGLSMVSDAGLFSLITMINIFTLAVILIMTYQCIASRSAQIHNDKVMIAFNSIKLRVLFILLAACTLIMFLVLPFSAYILF